MYVTSAMATSVQLSQPPQATGTAATTARKGMMTKMYSAMMMPRGYGPCVSGFGPITGSLSTEVMTPHNSRGTGRDDRKLTPTSP